MGGGGGVPSPGGRGLTSSLANPGSAPLGHMGASECLAGPHYLSLELGMETIRVTGSVFKPLLVVNTINQTEQCPVSFVLYSERSADQGFNITPLPLTSSIEMI